MTALDQRSSMDGGLISNDESNVQITCFSDENDVTTLHLQITCLQKQIYVWIGFNSARFGHLFAAAPTKPSNTASVTPLLGGASDNVGSGIARRIGSGREIIYLESSSILDTQNVNQSHPHHSSSIFRKETEETSVPDLHTPVPANCMGAEELNTC